ncbi:MAG: MaoC family dehydratase N-terminal domain-containing protein [Chrysiogenetes bacterium]|nr:MaoC family dehydratase N-terminal domain-containing protein [Chrysiogenetes bacterium]
MPLNSAVVGTVGEPLSRDADARGLMAYAAGIGESAPVYFDTTRKGGIAAHPVFPVSLEWPALLALRVGQGSGMSAAESLRGVHASQDTTLHRPIRAGEKLETRAEIAGVQATSAGAYQMTRFETTDAKGQPVVTTWYGTMFRGVEVSGESRPPEYALPALPEPGPHEWQVERALSAGAAHVYTECSDIWNPIHTDLQVAKLAGLPGLILHGTATLAMAVSAVIEQVAGGDPRRIIRFGGRFRASVPLPSSIVISGSRADAGAQAALFEVRNEDAKLALAEGFALLGAA